MLKLDCIATEQRNERTADIDALGTLDILKVMNDEDQTVAAAVRKCLPEIARLVDCVVDRLNRGGRLYYVGAGTSGRLGVLDAAECPPTFGVAPELVTGIIAGGDAALRRSQEGAEDDETLGANDLKNRAVTDRDIVVGIAASGRTPYVNGALRYARSVNARTAALTMTPNPPIGEYADFIISCPTGGEVITGSTRLKAGTATKLILNMITTAAMIKLGKVYGNLMVDVQATNEKLRARAVKIVATVADCSETAAAAALSAADGEAKTAILMLMSDCPAAAARQKLADCRGRLREALTAKL